jgi:hypothetical protein
MGVTRRVVVDVGMFGWQFRMTVRNDASILAGPKPACE